MNTTIPNKSFITADGGLNVCLDATEVSWFDFLWYSRRKTSDKGGWNSKSYWRERGVSRITGNASVFLKDWTINSLLQDGAFLPIPRDAKFMFDRSLSERRSNLEVSLGKHKCAIENATENELNYALYNRGFGKFKHLEWVELLGFEIPLAQERDGQLKVDLFGISSTGDAIEIIELKKANGTDTPLMALTEAICYGLQTLRCKDSLMREANLGEPVFKKINLTILAPPAYWTQWDSKSGINAALQNINKDLQVIIEQVNAAIGDQKIDSKLVLTLRALEPVEPTPSAS